MESNKSGAAPCDLRPIKPLLLLRPMPTPTCIRAVEITPLDIPLHVPFGISGGAQAMANNVLVRIELSDGTLGYGEAAPLPPYNGETQSAALTVLRSAAGWLVGREARAWRDVATEFHRRGGATSGSAQCALETALLDAVSRCDRVPLWKFFGGVLSPNSSQVPAELETDMTVTTGSVAEAAAAARAIGQRGIRMIKVKVGGAQDDLARVAAI
ncbi:MAG: hypothetical protein EXS43_10585, partial [Opitutus sp.]|nr:hypothetical protein [Opitutus sp.]